MTTVTLRADIEVDLAEIDTRRLVDEIQSRGFTSVSEVAALDEAAWRLARGDYDQTLVLLARALGPRFRGLAALAEDRRAA